MNWGILSTGVIAKNFAQTAQQMGDVRILAVASRSMESADAFADAYGIERRYAGYEALAKDPDVDIVYVATPHSRHYEDMKPTASMCCAKRASLSMRSRHGRSSRLRRRRAFLSWRPSGRS